MEDSKIKEIFFNRAEVEQAERFDEELSYYDYEEYKKGEIANE